MFDRKGKTARMLAAIAVMALLKLSAASLKSGSRYTLRASVRARAGFPLEMENWRIRG